MLETFQIVTLQSMDYSALKDLCPFHQMEVVTDCLVLAHGVNPLPEPNNLAEIILMSPNWELILADLTQWAYGTLKRQMIAYRDAEAQHSTKSDKPVEQ